MGPCVQASGRSTREAVIEAVSISKYYGSQAAVDGLSFSVPRGALVGLLGLNGAGKSTTLKILAGLLAPDAGQVRIDGIGVSDAPASLRKRIGYLPDKPPLYDEMQVGDFLEYAAKLRGIADAPTAARQAAERCALQEKWATDLGALSHGFRQRVGLAQAIVHRPALLLLDEPLTGLDPKQVQGMRQLLRNLGEGITVLLSTHRLDEIARTCDRLVLLHEGRLAAEGSVAELSQRSGALKVKARGAGAQALLQGFGEVHVDGEFFIVSGAASKAAEVAEAVVGAGLCLGHLEAEADGLEALFGELDR